MNRNIEVHIEELRIVGAQPHQLDAIAHGLTSELRRMLLDGHLTFDAPTDIEQLRARIPAAETGAPLGRSVARSVYQALNRPQPDPSSAIDQPPADPAQGGRP